MRVLAIESSCDETAAAVVEDGRRILANVVASQVDVHARYGGVVPELASRHHLEAITPVIEETLAQAGMAVEDMDGLAVTQGPGLIGSLLVGLSAAKAMAWASGKPLVGVNHLEGHIAAVFLEREAEFPFLALVVSGGHTSLYRVESLGRYRTLGQTRDDAAGEAFDKLAKHLELGYPGGVVIDRMAALGDPKFLRLPRALMGADSLDFSFSGLKTATITALRKLAPDEIKDNLNHIAASFQAAIVDVLVQKTVLAARQEGLTRVVISGGVAANRGLRQALTVTAATEGWDLHIPAPALCTDNAAMIGVVGTHYLQAGKRAELTLDARSRWPLDEVAS